MNKRTTFLIAFAIALPIVVLAVILPRAANNSEARYKDKNQNATELIILKCYVGENMVKPMAEIGNVFEAEHPGIKLEYHDSGTTSLDKMIRESEMGDLFLPGSNSYTEKMKTDGMVTWDANVCKHVLAAIVLKDSNVKTWDDVIKPSVMVGRGNENVCSVGRVAKKVVARSNLPEFQKNVKIISVINYQASSFESLVDGTVDVLLNWRNMSLCPDAIKDRMMVIDIPENINTIKIIPIAVLKYSQHPHQAEDFAKFVASEKGKSIFRKHGFLTINN